ncbi:MAG TPA: adenylate kinase [Conexivisphaerales archaeon]|nr:adenylate kinase [Conexivisphaerales archaeon]
MQDKRRIVAGGLPGVGKTTVITLAAEQLKQEGYDAVVVTLGSFMFEEAKKMGVPDRDQMRKLPVSQQRELQLKAARKISELEDDLVFVDTHFFIRTLEGYFPGLPLDVLQLLRPTQVVLVQAPVKEIIGRRRKDDTRSRDSQLEAEVEEELELSRQFLVVAAAATGATMTIVNNRENRSDEAVKDLLASLNLRP